MESVADLKKRVLARHSRRRRGGRLGRGAGSKTAGDDGRWEAPSVRVVISALLTRHRPPSRGTIAAAPVASTRRFC